MKKRIAIMAGGYSSEYQISINSAGQVMKNLDPELYETFLIHLTREGWYHETDNGEKIQIEMKDFSLTLEGRRIEFDCAFIAIHGTPGEDGKIQGYLDLLDIPYTGPGRLTSALTFNKYFCKNFLLNYGISMARTLQFRNLDTIDPDQVIKTLGLPCFVKPNEGGSSLGISRVNKTEDLEPAIRKAFKEDDSILIESHLEGRELTCGLIKTREEEHIFPITEVISKKEFFDYEAKYTEGMAEEITPAEVPGEIAAECQQLSSRIYSYLNCKGLVRIDYILSNNRLYFLEVNTIPGLSVESIVPKMVNEYGMSLKDLYSLCIKTAISDNQ